MSTRPTTVAPGVSWFPARTPTLPPATSTNSYALGTCEVLLVEPATPHDDERQAWLAWARGLDSKGCKLVAILATHYHPDHVGGARFFCDELGLPLWAHAETARLLSDVQVGRTLADGEEITLGSQRWRVLHTPGHAPDHLCLLEPTLGLAVVGDMVAGDGTILIHPRDGDLIEYLAQLERLATLGMAAALPAHGAPIERPERLFRHYIAHRLMRERKVLNALGPEPADLDALVARAYDDTQEELWRIAKLSLESHLVKLEREGRATRSAAKWCRI